MGFEDDGEEIFMLNLNRYKYADDEPEIGVPAAYRSYGSAVIPMILRNGGHPIFSAEFFATGLIEDADAAYLGRGNTGEIPLAARFHCHGDI